VILPGLSIGSMIVLSHFINLLWGSYKKYSFTILKIKLFQMILAIFSIFFNFAALFCPNVLCALILYSLGLMLVVIILDLEAIFLNYLRSEELSKFLLISILIITFSKAIALIIHPFEIIDIGGLLIRKAHLYLGSMIISTFLILLVWFELVILIRAIPKYSWRKKSAIQLFLLYSLGLLFPIMFAVGTWNELIKIALPYLEAINASVMFFIVVYIYMDNPEYLYLLPVDLYGVLLSTFNGISIYEICLRKDYERALSLSKSIILSLLTIDHPRGKELSGILRVFEFAEFKILVYISYFVVGVFVSNISNMVLINILKNITNEYEQIIKYPGDSLLMDDEKDIAEQVVKKYLKLLI